MATVVALAGCAFSASAQSNNWQDEAISPVGNPIYFEDPRITTEVRPIFMHHWLPSTFDFAGGSVPLGGYVNVYALQLRYAINDRWGIIATKDGYIEMKPSAVLKHTHGWGDLAAGVKYAWIDDKDKEVLVTPGLTLTIPTGSRSVYQGRGAGEWNLFLSAEKGSGKFHITGNAGVRIPNDFNDNTAQLHYSLQLDYVVSKYFIPFVVANGNTILTEGNNKLLGAVNLNTEMYDLINFGSTKAQGSTQITLGVGARSKLTKNIDVGVAYEGGVSSPVGIFDSRLTIDLIWRFK